MYLAHFGLFKKPFLISPDPEFLYPSPGHQEAFAHLRYGLQREGGFLVLTGEVGTGKTTLCRLLIEQLPEQFRLAYILNAQLDSLGLLRSICKELQIQTNEQSDDLNSYVEALYETLLKGYSNNQKTLIIIEEAQNLDPRVLETLRLLTNLETNTTKLLHILLIGQPELLDVLARPQLRQLNQRVVSRFHLSALSRKEVDLYVAHRLATACTRDGRSSAVFDNSALSAIYRHSKGIPRLINLLAEQALIAAYAENKSSVDGALVNRATKEALGEVRRKSPSGWFWPAVAAVAAVAGLLIAVSAHLLVETHNRSDKSAVASVVEDVQEPLPEVSFESPSRASSSEPIAPASAPIVPHSGGSPSEISTSMSAYEYPSVFAQWLQSAGIDGPA
ncbi:MAG: ExeA family protein, partial [bacterium]